MRDGLLISHVLGYCYFCKETVDLTLIVNHYEECVRKKQLSSVPRLDIVSRNKEKESHQTKQQINLRKRVSLVILVRGKIVEKIVGQTSCQYRHWH